MFYQTHHPFSLPFTSSSTSTPIPLHLLPSSSSFNQVEQRMDCVSGAFLRGGGFRPETAAKPTTQQVENDENAQNGVAGDDFFVDDLLDFSTGDIEDEFVKDEVKDAEQSKAFSLSILPPIQKEEVENDEIDPTTTNFSVKDDMGFVPGSELAVPVDDLADLEWLSNFVDDSFSQYSLTLPAGKSTEKTTGPVFEISKNPFFKTPVQTKARSKRARTGGQVWSLGSSSPATETSSSSSTSSSPVTVSSSTTNAWLIYTGPTQTADSFLLKPGLKKQKKKPAAETAGGGGARRCSHCFVQKTPQWRSGPLGAKTLCNACGVRYKSGRLLPEYRPACSPTFSSGVHSNNHRKVLEMRQKKEVATGLTQPVQSF